MSLAALYHPDWAADVIVDIRAVGRIEAGGLVVAWVRAALVNVKLTVRADESRHAVACVHVDGIDALATILTWHGRTFLDVLVACWPSPARRDCWYL